jgi:uncharacterized phage-associated protein
MIQFTFNFEKTVQALAYLLDKLGTTDKVKLMKLVYLSDRAQFIAKGYPITGDRQVAMEWGPVPSWTLKAVNGELPGAEQRVYAYVHLDDVKVSFRQSPTDLLTDDDREILNSVIREHGQKPTWGLVRETHKLPEYAKAYVEGTSTLIPYESIAESSGNPARFRKNRPVISPATAEQMICPFPSGVGI